MLTLSIRQPFAWLIVNGFKDIENRSWPTNVRGTVLVHAGKQKCADYEETCREIERRSQIHIPPNLELGGIVGSVEIVDCVQTSESLWFVGPYGFMLKSAKPLPFQSLRGKLGLFVS